MVDAATTKLVEKLVRKWGAFFGIDDARDLPNVALDDGDKEAWVARTSWDPEHDTSLMEIKAVEVDTEEKLDRIIAHEMIHHCNFLRMGAAERKRLARGRGRLSDDHGEQFRELAQHVNSVMGDGYVTERADFED